MRRFKSKKNLYNASDIQIYTKGKLYKLLYDDPTAILENRHKLRMISLESDIGPLYFNSTYLNMFDEIENKIPDFK
jgi:hypothetical protein